MKLSHAWLLDLLDLTDATGLSALQASGSPSGRSGSKGSSGKDASTATDPARLLTPEALAELLTMSGIEVEAIDRPGAALEGVFVAEVKASEPHPDADKLAVTRIDAGASGKGKQGLGDDGRFQVVCGAKNFKIGSKVPLATVGAQLPNGMAIKPAKLRGVESFGMLCSGAELNLPDEVDGLLILPEDAPVGAPLAEALGLDDAILTLAPTPNRPDALSHLGVAREVAALLGAKVRAPEAKVSEAAGAASDEASVAVAVPERCPHYAARLIEGIRLGPSPAWMQRRLQACGVRAINNVVDVTNYVLLELGQPLHAFDLDRLAGSKIVVRDAKEGEQLETLDGKKRTLTADDLVVCDAERPQALAGVMGGAQSEVTEATRRILLESAYFLPKAVRRTARRHGLHTEASHRFERGADRDAVLPALDRASALLAELASGGVRKGRLEDQPKPAEPRRIRLRKARPEELLGVAIPLDEAEDILKRLGLTVVETTAEAWVLEAPQRRVDLEREEDLIEELARVWGYEKIPASLPGGGAELAPEPARLEAERRLRTALAAGGFDEVINYSFVSERELEALGAPGSIKLKNPLSTEQTVMRTTLAAGLLQNVSRGLRHEVDGARLYELGRVYEPDPKGGEGERPAAVETLTLGGVLFGRRAPRGWASDDSAVDFYDAKGAVEALVETLRIGGLSYAAPGADERRWHPRRSAAVIFRGKRIGAVGELHPEVAKALDLPRGILLFELDAEKLLDAAIVVPKASPLPRHPAVLRDLALVVSEEKESEEIAKLIRKVGKPLVEGVTVFDVYRGGSVPEGQKSLAFALSYRAPDRTLEDAEVTKAHAKIVGELEKRLGGQLRA